LQKTELVQTSNYIWDTSSLEKLIKTYISIHNLLFLEVSKKYLNYTLKESILGYNIYRNLYF
jgi:hypothetical protein